MKKTITHPECPDLKGTVEELPAGHYNKDQGIIFEARTPRFEEWFSTEKKAIEWIEEDLENELSGFNSRCQAEHIEESRAERFACGQY
ncbi:MAG: hypothetical protein KAR20_06195 [Candidatus Heimdallarchaeota archaeon]|nr:hypothetical protein [Candidatus Heimdallarchaeota archaeon]